MGRVAIMKITPELLKERKCREAFTVCVVGCGRMGLPHACLFADAGFKVIGVDKNHRIIQNLEMGKSPFEEQGLQEKIERHVKEGRLTVTTDCGKAASESDIIFLSVNTPLDEEFNPDYSNILNACEELGRELKRDSLIIVASTVGPGVTETLIKDRLEETSGLKAGRDFGLAFSPIRATAGRVLYDVTYYMRVVGGIDAKSLEVACAVLKTIVKAGTVPVSSLRTAETIKLFQNVYRDVNLALTNEFALFCEKAGVDYLEVYKAANTDPYCHLLLPGLISGHIPKDPYLLIKEAEKLNVELRMATTARDVNEKVVEHTIHLVKETLKKCGKSLQGSKIAVLGISYKADVKETKGSRALTIINLLKERGVKLKVYDPYFTSTELAKLNYPIVDRLEAAVKRTDCVVITVGHREFRSLNLKELKSLMNEPPAILDLSHIINPEEARREGMIYMGLGRGLYD